MWKTITGEIKKIFTHKFFIVAIAAVTVVPMLYSYLYLDAFWDPYSRLEKLPVAVVNQDLGDENHKGVETGRTVPFVSKAIGVPLAKVATTTDRKSVV